MITRIRREWRCLQDSPPGKRFQRRYRRTRDRRTRLYEGKEHEGPRILRIVLALVLLVIGCFMVLLPLVYLPFFVASGAIFASESLTVARILDRTEALGWSAWTKMREVTGLSPRSAKVIAAMLGLLCVALTSYAIMR